jgi:hypothetical protein
MSDMQLVYELRGYREWDEYCREMEEPELDEDGNPEKLPEGASY